MPSSIMSAAMRTMKNFLQHDYRKYISLVMLIIQSTSLILWMRYIRTTPGDMFLSTTAVVCAEAFKCLASLLIILFKETGIRHLFYHLWKNIFCDPWDNVKMAVPSLIFTLQNDLQFLAISNLDAATYQVCYQLNMLTTALFSALMLNKKLSRVQWLSFIVLFAGVACVQFQPRGANADAARGQVPGQSWLMGATAMVASCVMSGFAGVYFEKILKSTTQSVWIRNVQLSFIGALIGLATLWIHDGEQVRDKGFFFGYTWVVWMTIALQSFGSLLVAVVLKYADNILKGFATSAAIVLSCVGSVEFFDFHLSVIFTVGATLVIVAVYMYSREEASCETKAQHEECCDGQLPLWHSSAAVNHNLLLTHTRNHSATCAKLLDVNIWRQGNVDSLSRLQVHTEALSSTPEANKHGGSQPLS